MIHETSAMAAENPPGTVRLSEDSPACRLIAAIMKQGVDDLRLGGRVGADALGWLESGSAEQPWSFSWCCSELGLDPSAVRQHVQQESRVVPSTLVVGKSRAPVPAR